MSHSPNASLAIWGTYTTVRYCLAFAGASGDAERVFALALGVASAIAVALIVISIATPLFPETTYLRAWRYTRSMLRACYVLLLLAAAVMNLVLVLMWHPKDHCSWDVDLSWYTSAINTASSHCHTASFAAWAAAAALRLVLTLIMALLFIYTARAYYVARHPSQRRRRTYHSSYFLSDPEDASPASTLPPSTTSASPFKFTRSKDSKHALIQSSTTLATSNSSSTLAPSLSYTSHSCSHSSPPKRISPTKTSPPTYRSTPIWPGGRVSPPTTEVEPETSSPQTQFVTSATPRMLRRTSRISIDQVSPTAVLPTSSDPEKSSDPMILRAPSDIKASGPGVYDHRGSTDGRKISLAWESSTACGSQAAESFKEGEPVKDDVSVYSYGYGASGPTYPYLDVYNPSSYSRGNAAAPSEHRDQDVFSPVPRLSIPAAPVFPDLSEPLSTTTKDDSSDEEEYVPMMGGFVRRMSTIESLGSKEAATMSTRSMAFSARSQTPASQLSSLRFANYTPTMSMASSVSRSNSLSTAYLSMSSGDASSTGMRVSERGELLPESRITSPLSYGRYYYTANGQNLPTMEEEDR
ncbi:hypothetical protein HYDPIDRAFT_159755 [Hydnomerulius pinastri MD-312]|uniref:Uncharacterized protein n=1 Tax=Hydnomerulius pinastri MD-312 TaxID=994086 RepID=A0A0C9VTE6_9AGAM|nr:hypothetical protein HYDPIDRAFT_159755 [Hydnomerulius pinastri MD-312]